MKHLAILTLGAFCLGGVDSFAKDAPPATPLTETLASVSAAELPAKIAALVKEAKSRDRRTTTITVVKAAVGIRPAAALAIVGAVARAVPEMTPDAAGTAAAEQPKLVGMIAKAAAAAAPSQAGKIVVAVCRAVPNEYPSIAISVAEAAPGSNKEILDAVAAVLPDLKPFIEKALASASGGRSLPSVANTLDQATKLSRATYTATTFGPTQEPVLGKAIASSSNSAQQGGDRLGYAKPKNVP